MQVVVVESTGDFNLNTYHVKVQWCKMFKFNNKVNNLNTYHVKVQWVMLLNHFKRGKFKYIPC